jgi:hypothetical protein
MFMTRAIQNVLLTAQENGTTQCTKNHVKTSRCPQSNEITTHRTHAPASKYGDPHAAFQQMTCVYLKLHKTYETTTFPTAHWTVANCAHVRPRHSSHTSTVGTLYCAAPTTMFTCSTEPKRIKPRNAAQVSQDTISVTAQGATRHYQRHSTRSPKTLSASQHKEPQDTISVTAQGATRHYQRHSTRSPKNFTALHIYSILKSSLCK